MYLPDKQGKRLFIKDIVYYLFPPNENPAQIAPSLQAKRRGIGTGLDSFGNGHSNGLEPVANNREGSPDPDKSPPFPYDTQGEPGNPTVVPMDLLRQFHFAILIRDPHSSIPSFYRCTLPPLLEMTGFHYFDPLEAGYDELIRFFHFLKATDQIGPHRAEIFNGPENGIVENGGNKNGTDVAEVCVIDADDLLDDPETIIKSFCKSVGLEYSPSMLNWDSEEDQEFARKTFAKWKGWHEDAINSTDLKPRTKVRSLNRHLI